MATEMYNITYNYKLMWIFDIGHAVLRKFILKNTLKVYLFKKKCRWVNSILCLDKFHHLLGVYEPAIVDLKTSALPTGF